MSDSLPSPPSHSSSRVDAVGASNPDTGQSMLKVSAETHQGALDAPYVLKAYHDISPALLDRVVALGEKQAEHRRSMESMVVRSQNRRSTIGMFCGVIVALGGFSLAGFMVQVGHPWAAAVFASINLVALVSNFVHQQKAPPPQS